VTCPNCKIEIEKGYICSHCGVDSILFSQTAKISNAFYNKGLSQAKSRNLCEAIISLNKSIEFNKNNHHARNLLGLIYYEIGEIGDALKQWIISASVVKKENFASEYIEIIQNNQGGLYAKNEAIMMYNEALKCLDQEEQDIELAIVHLKKSIDINPRFIQSMNLLALCYMEQNMKGEARELTLKTLKIDSNNQVAHSYYKSITGKSPMQFLSKKSEANNENISAQRVHEYNKSVPVNINDDKFTGKLNFMQVISFVAGGVCTALLMYYLILPDIVMQKDEEIAALTMNLLVNTQQHEQELLEINQEMTELENRNEELSGLNDIFNMQIVVQEKIDSVQEATHLYNLGNAEEAAEIMYLVDFSMLPDYISGEAYILREATFASAGLSLYNRGLEEFNVAHFEESKALFERSLRFAQSGANYIDDAIYFLGRIAEEQDNVMLAIAHFTRIVEEFPYSNLLSNANARLANLESE